MLDRFKVKEEDSVRVRSDTLRATVTAIFEKLNVPSEDAALGADVLVAADLRGVDSHGVSNMLRSYVTGYTEGRLNPRPQWRILRESPATANIDCDRGLGTIIAPKAMDIAIRKAKETGVGIVTMGNGRHLGMAGYHAMRALQHDMIGMCMTAPGPLVLPTFGQEARLGTNPIAVAVPTKKESPFVLDMATSVIAANKIGIARRLGSALSPGWIADEDGTPIMEEIPTPPTSGDVPGSGYPARVLPLGSTRELGSHKGYGLACVVEILCGILSGAGFAMMGDRANTKHFVAAYNVEAFTPVDEFKEMMDDFLRTLKETPPAKGHDRVLVAGQPEAEAEADRLVRGIPLHNEVVQWFKDICNELNVPYMLENQ